MTLKRLSDLKLTADTQTHITALITEQTGKGCIQSLNDESCLNLASREIVCLNVCVSERLTDQSLPDGTPSVACCTPNYSRGAKVPT